MKEVIAYCKDSVRQGKRPERGSAAARANGIALCGRLRLLPRQPPPTFVASYGNLHTRLHPNVARFSPFPIA
jgi:hypothetical protein